MANNITTLYISDTSIRLMVTRGKRISKLADASLDVNLDDLSSKVSEDELVAKIKHLLKTHKVSAKKVVVGLSGLHCLSRPAVLPLLPKAMIDEAMIREAKRVLPVPTEQLHISWQVLSVSEGKMRAFMVAIPRQIADTLVSIMHQVGLKPYLMDIKPLALARLVQEPTAVVVDAQTREFDIVILADGIPQPVRTVTFPQEALPLQDKFLIVKDELERTIQFYNSNSPGNPLQPDVNVFVSGELADELELFQSMTKELGHRVWPLTSPLKCPKQLDPAHYLVNIGLALKELPREAGPLLPNLNTLPVAYQSKPVSRTKLIALPATAVAAGIIVLLAMTIQDAAASIDSVQSKLDSANIVLTQKQAQQKKLTEGIAALEKKVADASSVLERFDSVLTSFEMRGEVINGDLETTVNSLVASVRLDSISHSGQSLSISGQASSEVEVLEYARKLDASGRFFEVTVSNIRKIEGSDNESAGSAFTLSLKLEEPK